MWNNQVRMSITFKNAELEKQRELFERFKKFFKDRDLNTIANLFTFSILRTHTTEPEKSPDEILPPNETVRVVYRTQTPITTEELFTSVIKNVSAWCDQVEKEYSPSLELNASFSRFPLYYRNGKFLPPRTYYDLNLVTDKDQSTIDLINSILEK